MKGDKVQFYVDYMEDGEAAYVLILSDGKDGFEFDTNFNPNKYALPDRSLLPILPEATWLLLTEKRFLKAEEDRERFFEFTRELVSLRDYATIKEGRKVFGEYFRNKEKAFRLLQQLKASVEEKRKQKDVLEELFSKRVLRCSVGYFVVSPNDVDVYYIPKGGCGATYLILWDWFGDLRDAVNTAAERNEPPKSLQDVLPWQLEEVIWTLTDPEGSAKAVDELLKAAKDFEKIWSYIS